MLSDYCKIVRFCWEFMTLLNLYSIKEISCLFAMVKRIHSRTLSFLKILLSILPWLYTFFVFFYSLNMHYFMFLQNGQYSNGTHCVDCPAGTYCPDPTLGSVVCSNGQYQPSTAQTSCIQCPSGQSCLDKTATPVDCTAGYFSLTGEETCTVSCSWMSFIVNILDKCESFWVGYKGYWRSWDNYNSEVLQVFFIHYLAFIT